MQTNKWICLKTRCVSCGFFSGFCGILVLGIMILEAVMGAEGQNRRAKVENEAWCCSVLMAFGRGAGSRGNTAAAGGNPPLVPCFGFASETSAGGETCSGSSSRKFICLICGCVVALSGLAISIMVFK